MVQTHSIFENRRNLPELEKRERKIEDPLKAFVKGVEELRSLWKKTETKQKGKTKSRAAI